MVDFYAGARARGSGFARSLATGLIATCLLGACTAAVASDADTAGAAEAPLVATAAGLEEVVVTARKREENVQDVPISIVTLSGADLDQSHSTLIGDIVQGIPDTNFQFINPRQTAFSIRGIGNNPATEGLETSVGLYLDGVYLSRPGMLTSDLLDIDRIEVLRGPQGTLFGKNTTAGAINIITRGPQSTYSADAQASVGNYGFLQEKADITGPLTSTVSARIAVYHTARDGTITDTTNDSKLNNLNKTGARAQLLFEPSSDFNVRLIVDWSHQNEDSGAQVLVNPGLILANGATRPNNVFIRSARFGYVPVFDPFARDVAIDEPQTMQTTNKGISAEANWNLSGYTLTSISAWRGWTFYPQNDLDYLPLQIQETGGGNVWNSQASQELRIASPTQGAFDYVAGAYLYWQRVDTDTIPGPSFGANAAGYYSSPSLILPAYALNGVTSSTYSSTSTRSYALFGQATWHLTDQWQWTAGLRSTYDDKAGIVARTRSGGVALSPTDPYYAAATTARNALAPPAANASARDVGNTVSGMTSLSYKLTEAVTAYATAGHGAKSGGINTSILPAAVNPTVKPEIANSLELGIKSALNRTLQFDADLFWSQIHDYQTTIRDPVLLTSYLANAEGVRTRGVEAELIAVPVAGLRLDLNAAYDDAVYTSFTNSPCPIEYTGIATICNLSGKPVSGAPRWTSDARAEYTLALGRIEVFGGPELEYRSSNYYTSDDSLYSRIPAYALVHAHLGARSATGVWEVSVWARNLLNRDYFTALNNPSGGVFGSGYIVGSLGDPRTYGVTLEAHF